MDKVVQVSVLPLGQEDLSYSHSFVKLDFCTKIVSEVSSKRVTVCFLRALNNAQTV